MYETNISGKVVVIGDTHGEYEATKKMLGHLANSKIIDDRWVVFLGDYVDQGPDTAKLISLLLSFKKYHNNTTFLAGNHDLNLAYALNIVESPHQEFYWKRIPERNWTVLDSYGAKGGVSLLNKMPSDHKKFLADLPWAVEHDDYLFVHAGFDPEESLDRQLEECRKRNPEIFKPKWLYSNRLGYVGNSHQTEKRIFTGHVNINEPAAFDNRVIIDTGAGYGGPLTAMLLPEMEYFQTEAPRKIGFAPLQDKSVIELAMA